MQIHGLQNMTISVPKISQDVFMKQKMAEKTDQPILSSHALMKYEFKNRLQGTISESRYDSSFLVNFANEYENIKNEITSGASPKDSMIAMLDEVYDETVQQTAKQFANTFEYFFDASSNLESRFQMGKKESIFDEQAFMNHLIDIANEAKKHAGNGAMKDELEKILSNVFQGGSLEKMSYRDITSLSAAAQQISVPSLQGDFSHLGGKLAKWNERAQSILQSSHLSQNVKDKALKANTDTTETYKKVGAYINTVNTYRKSIEEKLKELTKAQLEMDRIDKKLKDIQERMEQHKIDYTSIITQMLERQESLQVLSKGIAGFINQIQEERDSLVKNPSTILDREEYRKVEEGYWKWRGENEGLSEAE